MRAEDRSVSRDGDVGGWSEETPGLKQVGNGKVWKGGNVKKKKKGMQVQRTIWPKVSVDLGLLF